LGRGLRDPFSTLRAADLFLENNTVRGTKTSNVQRHATVVFGVIGFILDVFQQHSLAALGESEESVQVKEKLVGGVGDES
jgi:hypothetical protein